MSPDESDQSFLCQTLQNNESSDPSNHLQYYWRSTSASHLIYDTIEGNSITDVQCQIAYQALFGCDLYWGKKVFYLFSPETGLCIVLRDRLASVFFAEEDHAEFALCDPRSYSSTCMEDVSKPQTRKFKIQVWKQTAFVKVKGTTCQMKVPRGPHVRWKCQGFHVAGDLEHTGCSALERLGKKLRCLASFDCKTKIKPCSLKIWRDVIDFWCCIMQNKCR